VSAPGGKTQPFSRKFGCPVTEPAAGPFGSTHSSVFVTLT